MTARMVGRVRVKPHDDPDTFLFVRDSDAAILEAIVEAGDALYAHEHPPGTKSCECSNPMCARTRELRAAYDTARAVIADELARIRKIMERPR